MLVVLLGLAFVRPATGTELFSSPSADATIVLDDAGAAWGWGDNLTGNLGDGTWEARARPVRIEPLRALRWRALAPGARTLAVDQDRRLWVWGQAKIGFQPSPRLVSPGTNLWDRVAVMPALGVDLALDSAGQAWRLNFSRTNAPDAFAGYAPSPLPTPAGISRWKKIAAGREHALLLADSGRLFALGSSALGANGPTTVDDANGPPGEILPPEPRLRWTDIAAGPVLSLGRLSNGEWYAWGGWVTWTTNNEVRIDARREPTRLKRPPGVQTWQQAVAGNSFLLLVSDDGRPFGLGNNAYGQLTYPGGSEWNVSYDQLPIRIFPVRPLAQKTIALAAGPDHAFALGADGLVYTWGSNLRGQLGRAINGSTPQPEPVRGEAAPFSPTAEPLPTLGWFSYAATLKSPLLAGQPGQAVKFGLRRTGDVFLRIPVSFALGSPHSLPGLPPEIGQWAVNGLPLEMLESPVTLPSGAVELVLTGEPVLNNLIAASAAVFLRASAPPWIEWRTSRDVPLRLELPKAWSLPPSVDHRRLTSGVWRTGTPNRIELAASDPDGWVTDVELFAACPELSRPEKVGSWTFPRGFAGATNRFHAEWVAPVASEAWRLTTVVQDHAGSVVTNVSGAFPVLAAPRFTADWGPHPPVVIVPFGFALQLEDRLGGPEVLSTTLVLEDSGGFEVGRVEQPGFVREFFWHMTDANADRGQVILQLAGATQSVVSLPVLPVTGREARPIVTIEASKPDADEAGPVAGEFLLTRWGGDLGLPLEAAVLSQPVAGTNVPAPRREGDATALSGRDYRAIAGASFLAGAAQLRLPVTPVSDAIAEGNEAVQLTLRAGAAYRTVPGLDSAMVVIRDSNAPAPPKVTLTVPTAAAHPATKPLTATVTAGLAAGSTLVRQELLAEGIPVSRTSVISAPLPVGPLTVQALVTDSFGLIGRSDPVVVRVVPELKLRGRQPTADGHERWQLEASPEFQALRLESAANLGSWKTLFEWRPSPTNRVQTINVPAGTEAHFLRLVPAPSD
jgi:hypothetical protein